MRIGILLDQLTLGGPPKAALEEVRHLRKMGHDAELVIVFERQREGYCYEDLMRNIPIRWLSREFPPLFRRTFKLPFFSFFSSFHVTSQLVAPRTIRDGEYDVLVSHGTYTCFTAHRLLKKRGIPYVAYIWDPISYILPRIYSSSPLRLGFPILRPLAHHLDSLFIESALCTITGCNLHISLFGQLSSKKVSVVWPGCFPADSIPDKRGDYILAVTKWDIGKRPEFLLRMLKKLGRKVRLVMAGGWIPSSLRDDFIRKVQDEGLAEQVEVIGFVDERTLVELYSKARVLVHPIFEGFGMSGLEAASQGCPIIIPKDSGVTELFEHGVHGYFPAEGDADRYTEYVDGLFADQRLAWQMGRQAWEVAKQNTWEHHTERLLHVIQTASEGRR